MILFYVKIEKYILCYKEYVYTNKQHMDNMNNQTKENTDNKMNRRRQRSPPTIWTPLMNNKKSPNDYMVSATKTKNYLMDDPFCDFLDMYYVDACGTKPKDNPPSFLSALFAKGILFENTIIEALAKKYKKNFVVVNTEGAQGNNEANFKKTKENMYSGTPIISQGVLFNNKNNTFGCADLIVRSDFINKLVTHKVLTPEQINIKAPALNKYHYRVIDIKWTTLPLRAKHDTLRKDGFMHAYKGQLAIYNCALGDIQGYVPNQAYILGKGWKRDTKEARENPDTNRGDCFDKLGVIDYDGIDQGVIEETKEAIDWIRELKEKGGKWSFTDPPEEKHKCMFPNMRVDNAVYNKIKKEIALETKEVTLVCHVGKKQRDELHSRGIYTYTDPNCNALNMGITSNNEIHEKIDNICSINRDPDHDFLPEIVANDSDGDYEDENGVVIDDEEKKRVCRPSNWQKVYQTDMFFDFETLNTDFITNKMDISNSHKNIYEMIFMIGVGYIENEKWCYKVFTVGAMDMDADKKCMDEFTQFVTDKADEIDPEHKYPRRLFHWTNAEIKCFNNIQLQYQNRWGGWQKSVMFVDMYKVFLKEGIAIKGAFDYSLKSIGKALYTLGKIDVAWPDSAITDGRNAAYEAARYYANKIKGKLSVGDKELFNDIIKYNEIDCRMIYEIVDYIRKNHSELDLDYGKSKKKR